MKELLLFLFLVGAQYIHAQEMRCDPPSAETHTESGIEPAKFNGDIKKYLAQNACYPVSVFKQKISGKAYIQFDVETDGSLTNISVIKTLQPSLDSIALEAVRHMPKWKPAVEKISGNKVRQHLAVAVPFSITQSENGKTVTTPVLCHE